MSRLSDSRISHLAHLIIDGLWKEDLADFPNEARALAETKSVLNEFFNREDELDEVVRGKIRSLSPDSTNSGRGAISPAMSCISAQLRMPGNSPDASQNGGLVSLCDGKRKV